MRLFASPHGPWQLPVMRTPVALPPSSCGKERAMQMRRRFNQTVSFHNRLSEFIADARAEAENMPDGPEPNQLLKKIRQAEAAANIEPWANSPRLQPPK